MALDGVTVSNIVYELKEKLLGGRIDKIYQPEKDEIILSVRSLGNNYKLLLTANASSPRLHITGLPKDNPMSPPLFCMVLRKHLVNGKLTGINQPDFERIVVLTIEAVNEMGDLCTKKIIIEIMGKHSNIILTDDQGDILDAAKHVSHDTSSVREVLPGKRYISPPSKKSNPLLLDEQAFTDLLEGSDNLKAVNFLYQSYNGISPVMASQLCYTADIEPDIPCGEMDGSQRERLFQAFKYLIDQICKGQYEICSYLDEKDKPIDFACVPMTQFSSCRIERYESISSLLENYYSKKDNLYRMNQKTQDLKKLVQNNIERCVKKKDIQIKTLKEIRDRELYKTYGELLTANIYAIEKGQPSFTTQNYYDESLPEITIPLDADKTPAENAQKYFKRYNKEKRTFVALQDQIKQNDEELLYLQGVLSAIQNSSDEADIEEIRNELAEEGFAKKRFHKKGSFRPKKTKPLCFLSDEGFYIYVGKNNKQNDELTLKFANNHDLWLHTKEIPGSHVIIKSDGQEIPPKTIEQGAILAAYYSKAREASGVPVDYTLRRNVKKPNGSKPGMVIYESNRTAYVTPDEKRVQEIKQIRD